MDKGDSLIKYLKWSTQYPIVDGPIMFVLYPLSFIFKKKNIPWVLIISTI